MATILDCGPRKFVNFLNTFGPKIIAAKFEAMAVAVSEPLYGLEGFYDTCMHNG